MARRHRRGRSSSSSPTSTCGSHRSRSHGSSSRRSPGSAVSTRRDSSTSPRCAGGPATWSGQARRPRRRSRAEDVRPDPIALVVAAEAASAIGRPSEARRLATRATAAAPHSIDEIFAGMPRSGVWVPDANEPLPTAPTLFDRGPESPAAPERPVAPAAPAPQPVAVVAPAERAEAAAVGPMTMGFWDGDGTADQPDTAEPDPAREFEAGRQALVAGSFDEAALRFGLALRLAPALAPAVLEATEGARAASLSVVRGDAYRSAGHETEARQAYAIAAQGGLPERRSTVRVRPKPPTMAPESDDGRRRGDRRRRRRRRRDRRGGRRPTRPRPTGRPTRTSRPRTRSSPGTAPHAEQADDSAG